MSNYCQYFGFKQEPFSNDLQVKNLLKLPAMTSVKERFEYVLNLGGVMVVTGEVGSGKSTSLRYAQSSFHNSQNLFINIICTSGSIVELYRQLCWGLDVDVKSGSRALMIKTFKDIVREIVTAKKQKVIIIFDEAHLLRVEIFSELHTLSQFDNDSKNYLTLIFAGQTNLIDKLTYRSSVPLASRVIAKTHLTQLNQEQLELYVGHHLKVVGCNKNLFQEVSLNALYQASSGILRKINALARGALVACATEKLDAINTDHVRIAMTELL